MRRKKRREEIGKCVLPVFFILKNQCGLNALLHFFFVGFEVGRVSAVVVTHTHSLGAGDVEPAGLVASMHADRTFEGDHRSGGCNDFGLHVAQGDHVFLIQAAFGMGGQVGNGIVAGYGSASLGARDKVFGDRNG